MELFSITNILRKGHSETEINTRRNNIQKLFKKQILLGRSRKARYGGRAELNWKPLQNGETENRFNLIKEDIKAGEEFYVVLTSPYIGRDPQSGQYNPAYCIDELKYVLADYSEGKGRCWSFYTTGGFNRKWKLETPQTLSLSAGSTFSFLSNKDIPFDYLCEIENAGIGENQVEGFGRLLFVKPFGTERIVNDESPPSNSYSHPEGKIPQSVFAIERRILQNEMVRHIEEEASLLVKKFKEPLPTSSLLGRLRNILQLSFNDSDQGLKALKQCLEQLAKKPARKQLLRCKNGSKSLLFYLEELIRPLDKNENPESMPVIKELWSPAFVQRTYIIPKELAQEESVQKELERQFNTNRAQFIDALLAMLTLRNRQKG
jgi:CRISPR-associated protein Csx10